MTRPLLTALTLAIGSLTSVPAFADAFGHDGRTIVPQVSVSIQPQRQAGFQSQWGDRPPEKGSVDGRWIRA